MCTRPPQPAELGAVSIREPLQFIANLHRLARALSRLELAIARPRPGSGSRLFEAPVTTNSNGQLAGLGLLVSREVLRLSGDTLTCADGVERARAS